MALVSCPDCKKTFSDTAQACPSCGYAFQQVASAKIISRSAKQFGLFFLGLFGFVVLFSLFNRQQAPKQDRPVIEEKTIPYEILSKWNPRKGDNEYFGMHILVKESASKQDVMNLAQALKRKHAGKYISISIWDSREAQRRQDDESYPETELFRHYLVEMQDNRIDPLIRWVAEGRD